MSTISDTPASIGTIALPTAGTIILEDSGVHYPDFALTFTLVNVRIPVTDAAASGAAGSLKIFDFVKGAVHFEGCHQGYTAFTEGATLTGGAGDAAFKIGVGTAVAPAADNALTGTAVNVGAAVNVTLAGGVGSGTAVTAPDAIIDGNTSPVDLYLNVSGSAASVDATSYIDVTGTVTVRGTFVG